MKNIFEIDKKNMSSIKLAAEATGYSRDYITKLARDGKIFATQVGRQWFLDLDSLKQYAAVSALEQKIRQKHLSEERRQERLMAEITEERSLSRKQTVQSQVKQAKSSVGVLVAGFVACGFLMTNLFTTNIPKLDSQQVASVLSSSVVEGDTVFPAELEFDRVSGIGAMDSFSFAEAQQGMLLLPPDLLQEGDEEEPISAQFFSDKVSVRKTEDGQTFIFPVDKDGVQIGREIPFVLVPLGNTEKI